MINVWVEGNYFLLEDTIEGKVHEAHSKDVKITKDELNSTSFYIRKVGGWQKGNIPIPFAEIKKEGGVAFTDQAEFETFYRSETGKSDGGSNGGNGVASVSGSGVDNSDPNNPVINDIHSQPIQDNTDLANTKVASVTGYNVDNTDPKNPVILDSYDQKWDVISVPVSNVWIQPILAGAPISRNVTITVEVLANNISVGIDLANGVVNRLLRIDRDSIATFTTKTNATGQIDVFTSDAINTIFRLESLNN